MEGGRPQPGEAEGGGDAATTPSTPSPLETQLAHAWPWFLRGPEELHFTSGALLRQQLEEEMREVQNYVDHVRALTEARDALAAEYERENEELRTKLTQLQLEHESQHKEVAELLALEGLASIVHSSPSEQVAYLLVERSTLLERMKALEQELGAPHCLGRPCAASLQAQLPPSEGPGGGSPVWEEPEGAPGRLRSTQHGILALQEGERGELRGSLGAEIWQGAPGEEEEREALGKPSLPGEPPSALDPHSGPASELWKAREQNLLADRLLLHDRLCFPEAEGQASLRGSGASREAASDLGGCFKHELHSYRSELLRLYGELQVLQGAAEERHFLHLTHQKLLHTNGRLEAKVLELSHECERLNRRILRGRKEEEEEEEGVWASRLSCPEFPARAQDDEDQVPNQGGDGEPMWTHSLRLSEAGKMGELEKPGQATQEEQGPSFPKGVLAVQRQLSAHRERPSAPAQPCPSQPALGSAGGPTEQGAPRKAALQPQEEPPGQAGSSAGSPKKQLRLEQERTLQLRLQNLQLQQENIKHSHLREQLRQESQRAAQAEQRVQELEQRLQEEQTRRELLERRWGEQQEEPQRLWREEEARLLQALADRQAQSLQQEGQLRALEDERRALAKEHLHSRGHSQRLSEQLSALQQEKAALCEEQRQVLQQLDVSLRKQGERRLRHKARLRQVKETLLGEVKLRDTRIRHLENELRLSQSQAEKDQLLIRRVTAENESLFRERRKSLEQLQSLEEAKQSDGQALCTLQSRVQLLEGENQQLQDRVLQLSLQVGILERALRTIHVHSLEELQSLGFPECPLQRKLLPFPGFSFSLTRLPGPSGLRPALRDGQPVGAGQKALLSPLAFRGSGVGYLNPSGPTKPAGLRQGQPGHPVG